MVPIGRILIVVGLVLAGLGVVLMFSDRIPLMGKLPGDINIRRDNIQIYIPLTSSILISVIVSAIMWLISFLNKK